MRALQKYRMINDGFASFEIDLTPINEEFQRQARIKGLENPKTFGETFKRARLEKGLTQKELAEILDCTMYSIYKYESGKVILLN